MEVYDIIHGNINIDPLAKKIIDTNEFQRLRNIKQLGCCNFVFPSAVHTRFEHSIGVYHLANKFIDILNKKLTDEGYNPIYGARPLRRAIMHLLEDNLAGSFLNTEFKKGSNIIVTLDANGEVKINLTEGTVVPEEEDKSDVPQRRRFALSTMRKRKKEKADQDPVEPVEVS